MAGFFESVVLGFEGLPVVVVAGALSTCRRRQTSHVYRPLKTGEAHAASLRLCLLSSMLLKPANKLVAKVIDAT
jgi:hypothetical protein